MKIYTCKLYHQKDVKKIWKKYTDVENWSNWDEDIEYACLENDFVPGAYGYLKPKGFIRIKFKLNEVRLYTFFSDTSYLFGAQMTFYHTIKKDYIEHSVELEGFLKYFYKMIFQKDFEKKMPVAMQNFLDAI